MKSIKINGKFKGSFSFDQIKFGQIRTVTISKNNESSGKVNFPQEDIGKIVYILYPEDEET